MPRFDEARRAAFMHDLLRVVSGRPLDLLSFDQVRERLHLRSLVDRGLVEVPLAQIVGTLGREREFNRAFLPREESLRERWRDVEALAEGPRGFPPIELYQVGEFYFVVDGHHRVSVAKALGAPTIEARVQEFATPATLAPLAPEASIEELLLASARADFLTATGLEPEEAGEFATREPAAYERLLDHVSVHRYFRCREAARDVPWKEAVRSWRETVYQPMVVAIRASGILEDFPERSETDLYLFTMDHLHYLRAAYGAGAVGPESAVADVRQRLTGGSGLRQRLARLWGWLRSEQAPEAPSSGSDAAPPPAAGR